LVVDFVHGAALGASAPRRDHGDDLARLRAAFSSGLDTIVAGIGARRREEPPRGRPAARSRRSPRVS
jgi:hypothetical protein